MPDEVAIIINNWTTQRRCVVLPRPIIYKTNSRLVVQQRDQSDSTAEVDQLCFISVFNVIKLTKYVKINDKITVLSVLPL